MPLLFISWLLGRFLRNVAVVAIGLTALLALFDMLANASTVAAGSGAPPALSLLFYMLLRLPAVGVFILPFAVLIASVQTFGRLASQGEILALESAGFTLGKIACTLAAGAAALAALQFAFGDRVVTELTARMSEWQASGFQGLPKSEVPQSVPEWFFSKNHIIHLAGASEDGSQVQNSTIIQTDAAGIATDYWSVQKAVYSPDGWTFEQASGRNLAGMGAHSNTPPPRLEVPPPQAVSSFAKPVEELRFSQLRTLGWGEIAPQLHPAAFYRVWSNYRVAQPVGGVAMVLLAAPVCLQVQRNGRRVWVSLGILALGFLFFIAQGVLLAIGERGDIPPILAAWGVFGAFSIAGLAAITLRVR